MMFGRRRVWAVLILAILVLLLSGWLGSRWLLHRFGIQDWLVRGLAVGRDGLSLAQLQVQMKDQWGGQELDLQHLAINWRWFGSSLHMQRLQVGRLQMSWPLPTAPKKPESVAAVPLPPALPLPDWLPQQLDIADFELQLPCAEHRCTLQGALQGQRQGQTLDLALHLQRQQHQADLNVQWINNRPQQRLVLTVSLDKQPVLHGQTQWQRQHAPSDFWAGALDLPALTIAPWVRQWVHDWGVDLAVPQLSESQQLLPLQQTSLQADWRLPLPANATQIGWQELLAADWKLQAQVPVLKLPASWNLPPGLNPGSLQLQFHSQAITPSVSQAAKPMLAGQLTLHTEAALKASLVADVLVVATRPLQVEVPTIQLNAQTPQLDLPQHLIAHQAELRVLAKARLTDNDLAIELLPQAKAAAAPLQLQIASLGQGNPPAPQTTTTSKTKAQAPGWAISKLNIQADALQLRGPFAALDWQGKLRASAANISAAPIKPTAWNWQGEAKGQGSSWSVDGTISSASGLLLNQHLSYSAAKAMRLDWTMQDLFLLAGNPLQKTLAQWPDTLELARGRLAAAGTLQLRPTQAATMQMNLDLKDVSGVYDRSELEALNGSIQVSLTDNQLLLDSPLLSVKRFDPGIELGPLQLAGSYRTTMGTTEPAAAEPEIALRRFEGEALGGRIWIEPKTFRLTKAGMDLHLQAEGINLAKVLKLYAAQGMSGHGIIDADIPLHVASSGISVNNGALSARAPGGVLQYKPEHPSASMQSDPRMKLLLQALEDFHYQVLLSKLNYAENGKLELGVQLKGSSPQVLTNAKDAASHQQLNLNINVEDNLLKQLASLQLAGKLSAALERNINAWLRKQAQQHAQPAKAKP